MVAYKSGRTGARLAGALLLALGGCTTSNDGIAYSIPNDRFAGQAVAVGEAYRIGPSDSISVTVYGEPELSVPALRVDTAGNVNLPLVGTMAAAGTTTADLARGIEARLSPDILVNPQVTVNLLEAVSQKVTVEGEVAQPGVFQLTGPTTLLDVIAMSRGPTRVADLDEIAIFRVIDGKEMAAKFDLRAVRRGETPNPVIRGNDIVVVGFNSLSGAWRDFLSTAPVFALFARPFL